MSEWTPYPQLMPRLLPHDIHEVVATQVRVANYLAPPLPLGSGPDRVYTDSASLWAAILQERLRAHVTVRLENFLIFEWLPRSPGLFYTLEAEQARAFAMYNLIQAPRAAGLRQIDDADPSAVDDAYAGPPPDYMYIFDPRGKSSMLRGGIGCIRLKDKVIGSERVWFMSASSTPVAHEGFPIALPEHYFTQCIDQVAALGALPCSLVGKLQFVPDCLEGIYGDYAPVPQLYLMVDELCPASASRGRPATPARVSVAVSFESAYEGRPEMYASYVTFYPGQPGSLQSRADWLENTYVKGMYQGRIVTDFDEQMRRFRGAVFSLHKVLNDQITFREVDGWSQGLNFYVNRLVVQGLHQVHVERVEHMSQERVINLGHNNTINAPVIIADRIENSFNALAGSNTGAEVKQLLEQLIRDVTEASKAAPSEAAEEMARDVETLTKEVTSSKPRRRWYEISIEGLKQAAVNIGEVGQPILETVGKLLPLLIAMYPGT